jgi:hypothetical protein
MAAFPSKESPHKNIQSQNIFYEEYEPIIHHMGIHTKIIAYIILASKRKITVTLHTLFKNRHALQ